MSSPSVEKIKERLSIIDVVSSYMSLTQMGGNFKAKCPFHNEKTPSFFLSPERGTYYCFGCGAKGDIFSFVEHFEGTDFLGALKLLAERAGVTLERNFSNEQKGDKDRLYQVMEEATVFFEKTFNGETAPKSYLSKRGIADNMTKSFRIGYAPELWRSVSTYLIEKGFKKDELEKVGLIKTKEDGNFYDRFRGRIIFPISDSSGRVVAFSGRIFSLSPEKKESLQSEAKYLNSPETVLFNKSNTLFGIDKAKVSIKKRDYTIIVEGQLDLILSHQAGFTNTVAVSGTALSDRTNERDDYSQSSESTSSEGEAKINNLGLVRRLSSNIIFAFDGDTAGVRAVGRSSLIALSLEMQVKIAIMPEGQDPADVILEDVNKWKNIIKNSIDIVSFYLNIICQDTSDVRLRGKKIRETIFPFLSVVKSSIEKSAYISLIHKQTGLSENDIVKDFEDYEKTKNSDRTVDKKEVKNKPKSRRDHLEERLLGIIFWQSELNQSKPNKKGNLIEEIEKLCNSFQEKIGKENFEKIKDKHKLNSSVLAFEAEIRYDGKIDKIVPEIKETVLNLEEEILNEKLFYLRTEIYQKEVNGTKEEINLILKDYQKIVERIEKIKSDRTH